MDVDNGPEDDDIPEWLKRIRSLHTSDEFSLETDDAGELNTSGIDAGEAEAESPQTAGTKAIGEEFAGTEAQGTETTGTDSYGRDASSTEAAEWSSPEEGEVAGSGFPFEDLPETLEQPGIEASSPYLTGRRGRAAGENPPGDADFPAETSANENELGVSTEYRREQSHSWLPGWLRGLRPVEDAAVPPPAEPETPPQSSGPLAGLRGLLYSDAFVSKPQSSPALLPELRLDSGQRAHVDLLVSMLEAEGQAPVAVRPARRRNYSQRSFIWLISLVMLGAILWPLATTGLPTPAPALPEAAQAVYRLIEALSPGDTVLVVFDLEPGFTGELEAGAAPILDHLMLKGASLVLVSSSPTGPLLGERFITQTLAQHQFIRNLNFVNLGFLPGEAAGLASFAQNPLGTLPVTLDGIIVGAPGLEVVPAPLHGIRQLSDFDLVLVIANQPLAARAWVEQIQPFLQGEASQISAGAPQAGFTPLLMVVSAQAEPLIRPFYEANPRQIQGLVSGLFGGAAYAGITGRSRVEPSTLDAFGLASLAAALIILTGGLLGMAIKSLRQTAQA